MGMILGCKVESASGGACSRVDGTGRREGLATFASSSTWSSIINSVMANQARLRVGRGTSLGVLSGRLRGGFTASSIPRSRASGTITTESTVSPLSITPVPSPTNSGVVRGGERNEGGSVPLDLNTNGDMCSYLTSMSTTLQAVQETMNRKITSVEQQQIKLTESVKELSTLMKSQDRDNFSIKGSTWEVRNNGSKQSLAIKTNDAWFTQVALKEQAAKLFCSSLSREPADADINVSE